MNIIGISGLVLIVVGFGYEMIKTLQRKNCEISRPVLSLFIIASALLFYHAFKIDDLVFMLLNLTTVGINSVNFYYA